MIREVEKGDVDMSEQITLVKALPPEAWQAMEMINDAKRLLREEGVDQWQNGYPDEDCIRRDISEGKGYFAEMSGEKVGYLCIDFDGEPAYEHLNGTWASDEPYVVVHRMAFSAKGRGRRLSEAVLTEVGEFAKSKGVHSFRLDTDEDNERMKHILGKLGFTYRGTIWFDNSVKIAFDKEV